MMQSQPAWRTRARKYARAGAFLAAGLGAVLGGDRVVCGATTNFNWIAASPADYSVAADWDRGTVPGSSGPGINYVALFTNNIACTYYSNSSAVLDNYWVGQMSLGAWNNSTGTFVLNGGTLTVSNAQNYYAVTIGGRDGAGGVGGNSFSSSSGANSVGNFTMNGGALTVARSGTGYYHQDSFILGLGTNSVGTFTLNGGTANFLCGIEAGIYGAGVITVNGGALVDNGWFSFGRGNGSTFGFGTFNLTAGAVYVLPNFSGGTTSAGNGGFNLCQGGTGATGNISGGTLYCYLIGMTGNANIPRDTLNVSGGTLYIGPGGVSGTSSGSSDQSVNISGGTFHTVDMIGVGNGGVAGDTNVDILSDGTNWVWASTPSVNLTNSSFLVNGTSGPGYVTFAPELGRTITLGNMWSGVGGLMVDGPGTVALSGNNSYTGDTTVQQGTLTMLGSGSIAASLNIIVVPGAMFSGPGSAPAYTLGASQTLANSSSTAMLGGDLNSGPGTVALNYTPGTPAFTVLNGALGLSTASTIIVNNTGAPLGAGSYRIISAGAGGSVSTPGGLPGVIVTGGGVVAGQYASLSVSGNELYLIVTSDRPPVIANVVTNNVFVGSSWQIAITNLANLAGWSDPDGDPITLSSVGPTSANGINIISDGTNIYYNGGVAADDYFNYTITDGQLSAVGAVQLQVLNPTAAIPTDTNNVMSLDGTWRFYLEQTNLNFGTLPNIVLPPDSQSFQDLNFVDGAGWTNIVVPGNWEMFGFSPCTYYGPDNTCGLYQDWIQIPQSWQGRRVYLQFDGVLAGAEIWLNGQPVPVNEPSWGIVNYHESGWTSFQVDVTAQARFGTTNLLAVRVIKNTPSVDLETGDYFVLGGIYQPVTLYSVPQTNFADVQVETHLLTTNSAEVDVSADVTEGDASTPVSMILDGVETDTTATNGKAVFTQVISQPRLWSAEFPNLYDLTLQLKSTNGQVTETVTNRIGIREVTITNGVLCLNGVPVKFAGVCDHASSATNGSALGLDFWLNEIKLMKAANINAIRTTHYPPDPAFFEACDELGMYVMDELPYCWVSSVNNANMTPAFEQRARETIRRDRNHPCVVVWPIGNENSAGNNLQDVANLVKSLDPTRPRSVSVFNASQYNVDLSDSHYPSISGMQSDAANAAATGHPFIFLENPNTWDIRLAADAGMYERWGICLQRTWDICVQSNGVCGTFPFEWSDRSVQDPNPDSDYSNGSVQRLYSFPDISVHLLKIKGMVDGFRNERASVYEAKMIYSPIQISSNSLVVSTGQVSFAVQNRYSFTDLSYLTTAWQLQRSGTTIASGNTNISLPPLTSGTAQLSIPANALAYADTLRLGFMHPNGNDVYAYQFALTNAVVTSQMSTNLPANLPIPQFNLITRSNYNNPGYWTLTARFPASLTNVVLTPANATTLAQLQSLSATVIGGINGLLVLGTVQAGFTNNFFSYTFHWTGPSWEIQELGWAFQMPTNCDHFSWNRAARWTVYPATDIGRAAGVATPDSANVEYPFMYRPDSFDFNSTKYDCNWAALTTASGNGLRVAFSPQLRFHCKADAATNGPGYVLYVNQQVSPPNDISANVVSDLYMTLSSGNVVQGSFTVGSNSNLVSSATNDVPRGMSILYSTGGGAGGNQVELDFSGGSNTNYSVWASTNLMNWEWEGTAVETNPGHYLFFDPAVATFPYRFYRISFP